MALSGMCFPTYSSHYIMIVQVFHLQALHIQSAPVCTCNARSSHITLATWKSTFMIHHTLHWKGKGEILTTYLHMLNLEFINSSQTEWQTKWLSLNQTISRYIYHVASAGTFVDGSKIVFIYQYLHQYNISTILVTKKDRLTCLWCSVVLLRLFPVSQSVFHSVWLIIREPLMEEVFMSAFSLWKSSTLQNWWHCNLVWCIWS